MWGIFKFPFVYGAAVTAGLAALVYDDWLLYEGESTGKNYFQSQDLEKNKEVAIELLKIYNERTKREKLITTEKAKLVEVLKTRTILPHIDDKDLSLTGM